MSIIGNVKLHIPAHDFKSANPAWLAFWFLAILASGCSTAELTQRTVDEPINEYYRYIHVNVTLSDANDTEYVTKRFIQALNEHGLQDSVATAQGVTGNGLLTIEELDRHTETVVHRRNLGRTSLTMMRGRELRDRPVISLRATLIDTSSRQVVFQADYVTQGPWYADSSEVVGALVGVLIGQFEREGFIGP